MSPAYAELLSRQRHRLQPRAGYQSFDVRRYRGQVLVVCATGLDTPETDAWLTQLTQLHHQGLPPGVTLVWLSVGDDPAEVRKVAEQRQLPFEAWADPQSSAASDLNHWSSPTVHVLGKWGAVRYAGRLEPASLRRMLIMLTKESRQDDHQYFTAVGSDAGHQAPNFTATDLSGNAVELNTLLHKKQLVCLLFAGRELRATAGVVNWLDNLVQQAGPDRLTACVVFSWLEPGVIRSTHPRRPRRVLLLTDPDGSIARLYRFEEPPLWVLLGPRGRVLYRGASSQELAAGFTNVRRGRGSQPPSPARLLPP